MIATSVSGNIIDSPVHDGRLAVPIDFDWFETDKRRMSKVAEDGTAFGVMVGGTIRNGDVLAETSDKRYYARIKTTELIEIPVSTIEEMGRLCFELGNRHLSLKIEKDRVLVPYDHPTLKYTAKIGFNPRIIEGEFSGFLVVKAHAQTGTYIPEIGKTTGDLAAEEESSASRERLAKASRDDSGIIFHGEMHSHDGGKTWHAHDVQS